MYVPFCPHVHRAAIEPAKFQQKLTAAFKTQANVDAVCFPSSSILVKLVYWSCSGVACYLPAYIVQVVDEFCQGLSEYIDDPVRFRMSLMPTKIQEGANVMYVNLPASTFVIRHAFMVQCTSLTQHSCWWIGRPDSSVARGGAYPTKGGSHSTWEAARVHWWWRNGVSCTIQCTNISCSIPIPGMWNWESEITSRCHDSYWISLGGWTILSMERCSFRSSTLAR